MSERYRISELGQHFGVTTRTLRYYEDQGLIRSEEREGQGERYYNRENAERLGCVLRLRELEIPVQKIRLFLEKQYTLEELLIQQEKVLEGQINGLYRRRKKLRSLLEESREGAGIEWDRAGAEESREAMRDEEQEVLARGCIEQFFQDRFQLFFENCSPEVLLCTNYEAFSGCWRETLSGLGKCLEIRRVESAYPGVCFLLVFEEIGVTVRFVFDSQKISGFWLDYEEKKVRHTLQIRV